MFVLTFLVCVPWGCGGLYHHSLLYCTPPSWKAQSDSGTCTQDLCRRNVHTDVRPQQSCEAEVRGFPVFEGWLLVLTLQLYHITPNCCSAHYTGRQTDGRGRGSGFNWRSLWLPALRVWCTQIRAWTTWQVSPVEASGQKECLDFTSAQISAIITMQNNLFLSLNGTAWKISISLSQRCLTTAFTPAGAHSLEAQEEVFPVFEVLQKVLLWYKKKLKVWKKTIYLNTLKA